MTSLHRRPVMPSINDFSAQKASHAQHQWLLCSKYQPCPAPMTFLHRRPVMPSTNDLSAQRDSYAQYQWLLCTEGQLCSAPMTSLHTEGQSCLAPMTSRHRRPVMPNTNDLSAEGQLCPPPMTSLHRGTVMPTINDFSAQRDSYAQYQWLVCTEGQLCTAPLTSLHRRPVMLSTNDLSAQKASYAQPLITSLHTVSTESGLTLEILMPSHLASTEHCREWPHWLMLPQSGHLHAKWTCVHIKCQKLQNWTVLVLRLE